MNPRPVKKRGRECIAMNIVFCADCHLQNFNYRRTRAGLSERSIDFLGQLATIATHAIDINADMFVIAGDLYDSPAVNPNLKRLFRKNIILPLLKKKIKILVIGGNHDSHKELTYGCDIEDLNLSPGITVKRNMGTKMYKVDNEKAGFVLLPYMRPESVFITSNDEEYRTPVNEVSPSIAAEHVSNLIPGFLKEMDDADSRIVVGHYHVVGTSSRGGSGEDYSREMEFNRAMLLENDIDLAIFGHIHKHQSIGNKIVVPGSIEHVDFGERNDKKYFVTFDTSTKKWTPVELQCRPMVQIDVDIATDTSPTQTILSRIRDHDVTGALVKLSITKKRHGQLIDGPAIERALHSAFHVTMESKPVDEENTGMVNLSSVTLDPRSLLESFIETKYSTRDAAYRKLLVDKASKFLSEVS